MLKLTVKTNEIRTFTVDMYTFNKFMNLYGVDSVDIYYKNDAGWVKSGSGTVSKPYSHVLYATEWVIIDAN